MNVLHFTRPEVFVLTRFAIEPQDELVSFVDQSGQRKVFRDEGWLENRLKILNEYTIPSIRDQSETGFRWLVGVDHRVAEGIIVQLRALLEGCGEVLLVTSPVSFHQTVSNELEKVSAQNGFLTIRVDSDDAISWDYVRRVLLASKPNRALSFTHGVQLDSHRQLSFHRKDRNNPFLAYRTMGLENVFTFGIHSEIWQHVPADNRWTWTPMFARISHGGNTSKYRVTGWPVLRQVRAMGLFGIRTAKEPSVGRKFLLGWSHLGRLIFLANPMIGKALNRLANRFSPTGT